MLGAAHRAAHDVAAEGCRQEHVHERLPCGRDSRGVEPLPELGARLWPVRSHRLGDDLDAAFGLALTDALLSESPAVAGLELRSGERVEPPVVLGADEVQRAAVAAT